MKEIAFSIPVSGVVRIVEDTITVTINRAETMVTFEPGEKPVKRISLERGITMYDVILEAAREVIRRKGFNRFSAPELYHEALEKYPELKRGSFMSRVIASAPNHPSYRHHVSRRDYFHYGGSGIYQLEEKYMKETQGEPVNRDRSLHREVKQ